jgi:hypothetical protein
MPCWFTEPLRRQEGEQSGANQSRQSNQYQAIREGARRAEKEEETDPDHWNYLAPSCFVAPKHSGAQGNHHDKQREEAVLRSAFSVRRWGKRVGVSACRRFGVWRSVFGVRRLGLARNRFRSRPSVGMRSVPALPVFRSAFSVQRSFPIVLVLVIVIDLTSGQTGTGSLTFSVPTFRHSGAASAVVLQSCSSSSSFSILLPGKSGTVRLRSRRSPLLR